MMGLKTAQPKFYYSFSLDQAVPSNHLVRRLAAAIDFGFVRGLVRLCYSHTGKPSVDPVVLFKLSLLGYLFNIVSERRLCQEAGLNLAWRWFLGYELDEPIPDHSVLSKARRRFGPVVYERFFRRIVQLCEERGLVQGDVLFVDSTLSKANASADGLRSRRLLEQKLALPERYVADLWAINDELGDGDEEAQPPPRIKKKSGRPPNTGRPPRESRAVTNELSVSPVDPEAQMFRKPGKPAMLAHKTHFGVDGGRAGIITAVDVGPACEADSHAVVRVLAKHELAVGRPTRELVGDRGYGSEAAFKACLRRGVQPTIGIRSLANRYGFNRDLFTYVPERDLYICPEGKELHRLTDNPQFRQSVYRPARGTCQNCPLKANCAPGRSDRHIIRRWETALWEELEEHLKSRHARSLMRRRRVVSERTFADAKTKHGLDRAQFRGRVKMRIQALLTASAMNLRQLVKRQPVAQAGMAALAAPWRPVDDRILAIQRLGALVATLHEALGRRSGLRTSLVVN